MRYNSHWKSRCVEMVLPLKPTPAHPNCLENTAVQTRFFLTLRPKFTLDSTGLKLVLDWSLSIDRLWSKSHINLRKEQEKTAKDARAQDARVQDARLQNTRAQDVRE